MSPFKDLIKENINNTLKKKVKKIYENSIKLNVGNFSDLVQEKIENNNAIIATENGVFAGFCYIEIWGHGKYVAHSGLIVSLNFRGAGLAKKIKRITFDHSKSKYPKAKIFGITTALPVMKINYELGYKPVTFSELTDDDEFWIGCKTCKNYDVLTRTKREMCLCTGMLYEPKNK